MVTSEEETPVMPRLWRLRRLLTSVGVGAVWAAVSVAVVSPVFAVTSDSPPRPSAMAGFVAIWVFILLLLAAATHRSGRVALAKFLGVVAVAAAAWGLWDVRACFGSRAELPLVPVSTGGAVMVAAAMIAATTAAVLGLVLSAFLRHVDARTAVCAYLVVLIGVSALIHHVLEDYRARLWHPGHTAAAAPAASLPDRIGPARYRLPLLDKYGASTVLPAGNGFIVRSSEEVTAYDGPTGALRWRAKDFGEYRLSTVEVVRRDLHDTTGIVVLFFDAAVVALDGSSGAVVWRRHYSGRVIASSASVDGLGIAVDDDRPAPDRRTMVYSLGPANGELRWRKGAPCSHPTGAMAIPGQLGFRCEGTPSIIDAHNGNIVTISALKLKPYEFVAGSDVYLARIDAGRSDGAGADTGLIVIDPTGRIIDQISGLYAISTPADGRLLLYDGRDNWTLRDYHQGKSTPVPIHLTKHPEFLSELKTTWLKHRLVFFGLDESQPVLVIDPETRTTETVGIERICPFQEAIRRLQAVAGAVIAECGENDLVGLVPAAF
ncbi:outer membrane protein assembly factor BamB family protein [Mycobacterium camsae]|uniref:outer membrane protein assembly factor BamB family protein n=1 Tax=Mycobacterium gordonae TaxID=1778 RepID=UPI0019807600|nr:PQQ-binding-like beta-propeller repeat protein [Mycobacterium gordonae]